MKHKMKENDSKIKQYQNQVYYLQCVINENEKPKSPNSLEKPSQAISQHYQQQLRVVESSQKAVIDAMEKIRLIEK